MAPELPRIARRSRAALLGATALCATLASGCYESHERRRDGEVAVDAGPPSECPPDDPACSVALYGGPAPADLII